MTHRLRSCVLLGALFTVTAPRAAQAQNGLTRTITLHSSWRDIAVGESVILRLPGTLFVHKLFIQAEAMNGNASAEVVVNGDVKGNIVVPWADPIYTVTVKDYTSEILLNGTPTVGREGVLRIRTVRAVVSDDAEQGGEARMPLPPCLSCRSLPFPHPYQTWMGNVSNQAIQLVDRLRAYTNYEDYGLYLLPIRKAGLRARAMAEARGDASLVARPYYEDLLMRLDSSEPFLDEHFEMDAAVDLAFQLLRLREYIRQILD